MEVRQLLSAAVLGFAVPQYQPLDSAAGVAPAFSSSPTGFSPQQIRHAYGFDQVHFGNGAAANGAGTRIAIVDAYDDPNIASDLHQFDLAFDLPDPMLTTVNQSGGASLPAPNREWITEIALDVEWAHAIAPKANILLVEANSNSDSDLFAAVNYARGAVGVVAVSMSWDGNEFASEAEYDNLFTTPTGHGGVSFVVSSGDSGSPVSYPSASPNVLSVGGTWLGLTDGSYSTEAGWNGSGGGISAYEVQPQYQQGIVTQSTSSRTNPDVAYDSDPYTGFPVYDSYNNGTLQPWGQWGGTSDAAPQWSALIAIVDQGRTVVGLPSLDGSTQLLPALYQFSAADFHDMTTGVSNGSPSYSANTGYDLVTGRGTPIANRMIPDLIGKSDPTQATHFAISAPVSVVPGAAFSITVTALNSDNEVCPGYQGAVQFLSTDPSAQVVLPTRYSFTPVEAGRHTFTGLVLFSVGIQSVSVKDSVAGNIAGTASLSIVDPNSVPIISGSSSLAYVKNQAATAIDPAIVLSDSGHATFSSATVTLLNAVADVDVLAFVNSTSAKFGNIAGVHNSKTEKLTLSSAGATATVAQFQAALRAVSYFNRSGDLVQLGTRSVMYQVSNGTKLSNLLTSYVTISNPNTNSTICSSTAASVFGQQVTLTATIAVISPGQGTPTGGIATAKVTFLDASHAISGSVVYQTLNGHLIATLTTSELTAGIHQISCVYSGDVGCLGSASATTKLTVFHAGTTAVISSSHASVVVGQSVTFNAIVQAASPGKGTPTAGTGTAKVTFMDGGVILPGTVSYHVVNEDLMATLSTSSLLAGVHSIFAVYSRDANFLNSTAVSLKQAVVPATPTCTVSSSAASNVFGWPVTLTATIGSVGIVTSIPTGQVTFLDGLVPISGTVTEQVVNGKLVATLTTANLSAGSHVISAAYAGDVKFRNSTSAQIHQVVSRPATTIAISSSPASGILGQPVTLTASIAVTGPGSGFSVKGAGTGNVMFLDGYQVLAGNVAYRVAGGKLFATLVTAKLSFGDHQITANFSGNSTFLGSTSTHLSLPVSHAATTLTVSTSTASPVFGQALTLTATIRAIGNRIPMSIADVENARIEFRDGSTLLRGNVSCRIVNGNLVATLTTSGLAPGRHPITASYAGDSRFIGSSSVPFQQTVFHAGTTTDISSSADTAVVGQLVKLTATISVVNPGSGWPTAGTGTAKVTFMDGEREIAGVATYSVVRGKLVATLTTTALPKGIHSISAYYSHDANFLDSASRSFHLTIA